MEKLKRGGIRKGSGRKQMYGEKTGVVAFKCPLSKKEIFKKAASKLLVKYEK